MSKENKRVGIERPYKPFFVPLKSVVVESLDGHGESGPGLHGSGSVLLDPAFEHAPKTALAEQALGPEIPGGLLEVAEPEFAELRCNFQFLAVVGRGQTALGRR